MCVFLCILVGSKSLQLANVFSSQFLPWQLRGFQVGSRPDNPPFRERSRLAAARAIPASEAVMEEVIRCLERDVFWQGSFWSIIATSPEVAPNGGLARDYNLARSLPSLKLTLALKIDGWNTSFLLECPIFRGYVSFGECTPPTKNSRTSTLKRDHV